MAMKKILVLTDFSTCAYTAFKAVIDMSKRFDFEMQLLHITDVPVDWIHLDDLENVMYQDVNQKVKDINSQLDELVKEAEKNGITANHSVNYNQNNNSIAHYLENNAIDYVIMGSNGAKGLKELIVGSNAQEVVRFSSVPVLVIKNSFDVLHPNLVFISDFEAEMMEPFKKLVEFASNIDAPINIAYIKTSNREDELEIKRKMFLFEMQAGKFFQESEIVEAKSVEAGIEQYCSTLDNAVISMATHGRTGIPRFLLGSLTEKVVNHSDLPVLSLHIE